MAREEVNVMVCRKVHKALKLKAIEEDMHVKELTNSILANALGMGQEAKANGKTAEKRR